MKNKAARLGQAQLASVIAHAADAAKARIEQLDPASLDDVSGGIEPLGDSRDDWATDGAVMPYPDPFEDLFGSRDPFGL